jgi:adenylate kinase family enzyme
LQKIGIIPDKFILLNVNRDTSIERIKKALIDDGSKLIGTELDRAAETALTEYELHIKGVKESYSKFIYEADADKSLEEMEQDLLKMVQLKVSDPMRPPRVIILGPPGSGRSTQAKHIAKKYGIIHVSIVELLRDEMK